MIESIRCDVVNATSRTNWVFVTVRTADGLSGVGEATLDGHEVQVRAEVDAFARVLVGGAANPNNRVFVLTLLRLAGLLMRRRRVRSSRRCGMWWGSVRVFRSLSSLGVGSTTVCVCMPT